MLKWFKDTFGGFPMTFVDFAFTDKVSGKAVNYYRDRYGRKYLANSAWDTGRMLIKVIPLHD